MGMLFNATGFIRNPFTDTGSMPNTPDHTVGVIFSSSIILFCFAMTALIESAAPIS